MNLFMLGDFQLHSGSQERFKIECDALTQDDLRTLAWLISKMMSPFGQVEGVPRGGLALAKAVKRYTDPNSSLLLIVDDVYTTGASMEQHRDNRHAKGAVIFARKPIMSDSWIRPIFLMSSYE